VYEKTVVGWDGSAPADAALDWAVERASGRSNSVRIVRSIDDAELYSDELDARWAVAVATFALAERAAKLRASRPELEVNTAVTRGEAGEILGALAGENTLVVVGSQGGYTGEYWYTARLGARLAALARGAVAVIPVRDSRERSGVLVGVDESDGAVAACLFAAELACLRGESLHLVHACTDHPPNSDGQPGAAHEAVFDRVLAPVVRAFPTLTVHRHVEHTAPAAALILYALDASLAVVGTRRPGAVRRLFLGSVSHTLVNNARSPTIVVAPRVGEPA